VCQNQLLQTCGCRPEAKSGPCCQNETPYPSKCKFELYMSSAWIREKGILCRLSNCARGQSERCGRSIKCRIVARGGSSSDSKFPLKKALTCHSRSVLSRRTYPNTWPCFQICRSPALEKPSAMRVRRKVSKSLGEIESTDITSWCRFLSASGFHTLLPRRPPGRRVPSCGIGVTSSILPILKPVRASILIAAWAPGPGVRALCPPGALTRMCRAVIPLSFAVRAAAAAACIAA